MFQTKCKLCGKKVVTGGIELGDDLFCGRCFDVKSQELRAKWAAQATPQAPVAQVATVALSSQMAPLWW